MKGFNKQHFRLMGAVVLTFALSGLTMPASAAVRTPYIPGEHRVSMLARQLVEIEEKQCALERRSREVYREQLLRLMEKATQAGNLVAYIQVSDEFKRFEREGAIPEQHEAAVLQRLLRTFHGQKKQVEAELHQTRISVANQLHSWYKRQEIALVKEGKISEAKQMRAAQEALMARMKSHANRA